MRLLYPLQVIAILAFILPSKTFAQAANDNCADAIHLDMNTECTSASYSSIDATAEPTDVAPNPSCGFYQGADVWFTFTVPASGNVRIEASGASGQAQWALYTGSCGSMTEVLCGNTIQNLMIPALAGQTLYMRSFRQGSADGHDFNLCVWEYTPEINNDCSDATELSLGLECNPAAYSTTLSTGTGTDVAPVPSCGFYSGGDVWFKFEVPLSGRFRIEASSLNFTLLSWALYSGSCGAFAEVACSGSNTTFVEPGLAGETLYLRVYRFGSRQGVDFNLCVYEVTEAPVNDDCANALSIDVGFTCIPASYSSELATAEPTSVAPNPSCGFYQGGDVWFKFDVPPSGNFRIEFSNVSPSNVAWEMYTGSCEDFEQLDCRWANAENFFYPELAGEEIHLRAYRVNNAQGQLFDLCIWEITPPENTTCAEATELTVSDQCSPETYSSMYAPTDGTEIAPNPSCGFFQGGDVWFRFVAPAEGKFTINVPNQLGGSSGFAGYTGSCGEFEEVFCFWTGSSLAIDEPSLGGEEIYLRAYRANSSQGASFGLCVRNDALPENASCTEAVDLPIGSSCEPQEYNTYNASSEAPEASCIGAAGGEVWFSLQIPATGQLSVQRSDLTGASHAMALFSGSCEALNEVLCSSGSAQLVISDASLANQEVYLAVYSTETDFGGSFSICAVEGDCAGVIGGDAFFDDCGICVGGSTGLEACGPDCNGVIGGSAFIDNCGECVGGDTGLEPCTPCIVEGGTISTTDPTTDLCVGDGVSNIITVQVSGNVGVGRFGLVRPGSQDVVAVNSTGVFNMENYPAGNYQLRHVSVNSISDLQGVTNGNQLSGCFSLSNGINVNTIALNGGGLSANGPTTLCSGSLSFSVSNAAGPIQRFVLLNAGGTQILGSNVGGSFNFNNYPVGSYRVVHASYTDVINFGQLDPPNVPECMSVSNFVVVNKVSCSELSSSPNPANSYSEVSFSSGVDGYTTLEVYDLSGRLVDQLFHQSVQAGESFRLQYNTSSLPNGVYLYRMSNSEGVSIDKFMVAH